MHMNKCTIKIHNQCTYNFFSIIYKNKQKKHKSQPQLKPLHKLQQQN